MEKPSQRLRDQPLLVPFISGRKKSGIEQHGSSQIDKLCLGVERMVVRVVERTSNRRHDSPYVTHRMIPMIGATLPPRIHDWPTNIAHLN
jgi:hypothetical protein